MTSAWQTPDLRHLASSQILWTAAWHLPASTAAVAPDEELYDLVCREHRANFALWHEEDKARDPLATDTQIATVKRAIDALNQQRNDLVEQIDEWLLHHLPEPVHTPELHSETPGMMLDRLSILALKVFHTREEADRPTATPAHRAKNLDRLTILEQQRADLVNAATALIQAVLAGTKSFKLYRQMKMYNDPDLNPQVYGKLFGKRRG